MLRDVDVLAHHEGEAANQRPSVCFCSGGYLCPPLQRKWKCVPPLGAGKRRCRIAACACPPTRLAPSSDGGKHCRRRGIAAESRGELLVALSDGVGRRRRWAVAAVGEATPRQRVRQIRAPGRAVSPPSR